MTACNDPTWVLIWQNTMTTILVLSVMVFVGFVLWRRR